MTYAESCARWIEKRWEQGWEWRGTIYPSLDRMRVVIAAHAWSSGDGCEKRIRAMYDAIVRERGK